MPMSRAFTVDDLNRLASEQRNPRTGDIDTLATTDLLARINDEDARVAAAVRHELPQIARAVDATVAAFRQGGRLVYIGAGTSGRLGVLDASECPPTFSVPPDMVVGLIAGGDTALRTAVEGAEDNARQGARDLQTANVTAADVVLGLTASGRTPYVIGALRYARSIGARTVALTCVPAPELAEYADISIAPEVGPEVLTGSTRMKSGTAQKMVLNMISTAAMIRIGKTYRNLMVDVAVSNEKLRARALGILCTVTGLPGDAAAQLLAEADDDVKTAIVMHTAELSADAARARLAAAGGVLRGALTAVPPA